MATPVISRRCVQFFVHLDLILAISSGVYMGSGIAESFYRGYHSKEPTEFNDCYKNGAGWLLVVIVALSVEGLIFRLASRGIEENDYSRCFTWFCYRILYFGIFLGSPLQVKFRVHDLIFDLLVIIYRLIELLAGKQFLENLRSGELLNPEKV